MVSSACVLLLTLAACDTSRSPEPLGAPTFGVNADPSSPTLVEDLAWAEDSPVRLPIRWDRVQPEPGPPDWAAIDPVMARLLASGHPVLAALTGTPDWARDLAEPPRGLWLCTDPTVTGPTASAGAPPRDTADLAEFAALFAARYHDNLYGIEVWPEPNLLPNWSAAGPDPEAYGRMFSAVADRVREVAPTMKVVTGGLAPTTDVGVCYLSDLVFLDRLAKTGALAGADAVSIEPYGLRDAPVAPPDRENLNFRRAELAHDVLVRHGLDDKPLWAVAWGWNAGQGADRSPWGSHPPELAAGWTQDAYGMARTWPWLEAAFLWHLGPDVPASTSGSARGQDRPVAAAGFALVDGANRPTRLGESARALVTGPLPSPPALPTQPVGAHVLALAMLGVVGLVGAGILFARRTPLGHAAQAVAARCRLTPAKAAAVAVLICAAWVALGRMPASAAWFGIVLAAGLVLVLAGRPELAPAASIAAAPFHSALAVPVGPISVGFLEAVIACAFAGWAIAWVGSGRSVRPAPVDWLVVALVVWGAMAVIWSRFPGEALREWRVVLLEPALVFLMLRAAASPSRTAERALDGLVAGGSVAAVWGLAVLGWAVLGHEIAGVVRAEGVLRTAGPYGSPNNLALFAGRAISAAAATALFASTPRRRGAHAVLMVVLLLAIGATFSRGALLIGLPAALLVLLAVGVATRGTDLRVLGRAAVILALAALVFLAAFARTERIAGAFRPTVGGTLHLRLRLWESALRMGLDHPILGVGPDNFLGHYRDTYVQRDAVQERFLNHPHNLLLDTWTRLGIVGLAAVALIAVRAAAAGVRGLSQAGRGRALGAAALVGLAYTLAHGLIDNFLFVPDLAVAWWVLVAAALAAEGEAVEQTAA